MPRKQCLQIEVLMYRPYPEKVDPASAPGCMQWLGPQEPSWRNSNWVEGLYLPCIYVLLWGWSIIFHTLHFPALTLLLKNLNFLWSGFPKEENPGVLHTFLYHFIFPVLKYRRAAESRKKETFCLVFGDSSRLSHRVLCFCHGGLYGAFWICQYNKMSPAFRKIVWAFFLKHYFLNVSVQFYWYFPHYFMVTK